MLTRSRVLPPLLVLLLFALGRLGPTPELIPRADAQAVGWAAAATGGSPQGRQQHGMAADSTGNVFVFGGGDDEGDFLNDLWRYSANTRQWTNTNAGGARPPRLLEPHLVVDTNGDVYEFGGLTEDGVLSNGLYRYRPSTNLWTDLSASAIAARVPGREDHGWVLDPVRRQIYAWGGLGGRDGVYDYLNDFWRYDIATDTWTDITGSSGSGAITPREIYNITYDNKGHFYLFGGTSSDVNSYAIRHNDFWRYDIANNRWEDITALTGAAKVPGRHYYGQACDADGNFYLIGGWFTPSSDTPKTFVGDDFWKFDAAAYTWTKVTDQTGSAAVLPRIPYVMAFLPTTNSLLMFSGSDSFDLVEETWVLNLTGLIEPLPTVTPSPMLPTPAPTGPYRLPFVGQSATVGS